ncbi:MAG: hypothetical protein COA78_22125 [Blastopirellula sp.]|nr:MAG: hypothetical protein COA78_22125 [Blastopirellula sp.]
MKGIFKTTWLDGVKCLVPNCNDSIEMLEGVKNGKEYVIELKSNRYPKQHKLFFALLKFVVENSDKYVNTNELLDELKLYCGHAEKRISKNGTLYYKLLSINFATMGQEKFKEFFNDSVDIISTRFVPTLDKNQMQQFWSYLE